MNFKSYEELLADTIAWERDLPHYDAVCGVPRSGLIPAGYLATRRNVRMVALDELMRDPVNIIARSPLRKYNPIMRQARGHGNTLLIVDDAIGNGTTLSKIKERLSQVDHGLNVIYSAVYKSGAIYHRKTPALEVDYFYEEVPQPRIFGWNWFRHNFFLAGGMVDFDGVLCEDWKSRPEQENDAEFLEHVKNAKPLYIPHVRVSAIVTSRLEKYRDECIDWLRKHEVLYSKLIMHPAKTPQERREARDHAERKASAYAGDPEARLFVESDVRQAKRIFDITGKPVLCTDTMTCFSKGDHETGSNRGGS